VFTQTAQPWSFLSSHPLFGYITSKDSSCMRLTTWKISSSYHIFIGLH
jgi:hypothetical protein